MKPGQICIIGLLAIACAAGADPFQPRLRTPLEFPDIPGYLTLKCDFHMHTVFSDGKVWPDMRAEEAWREGLDAIAITDHIEYQPHRKDLPTNHNRSHEIAAGHAEGLGLIVIRGAEITRNMPPGHLNAIFLEDAAALDMSQREPRSEKTDWRDALAAAHAQQAFIFWNHPSWIQQAPDGIAKWYPEHTEVLESGMLHGIEVVNDHDYSPEAHQWAIDKNLTLLSNSDIHGPTNMQYAMHLGGQRPVTLVFAREATAEGIREALFARRTALRSGDRLIGSEDFLAPLFTASVRLPDEPVNLRRHREAYLQIHNAAGVAFHLERVGDPSEDSIKFPDKITLYPGKTSLFPLRATAALQPGRHEVRPSYRITNLLVRPNDGLVVELPFTVELRTE